MTQAQKWIVTHSPEAGRETLPDEVHPAVDFAIIRSTPLVAKCRRESPNY